MSIRVTPLDPLGTTAPWDHEARRSAVTGAERLTAVAHGEVEVGEIAEGEQAAVAGEGAYAHAATRRVGEQFGEGYRVPRLRARPVHR